MRGNATPVLDRLRASPPDDRPAILVDFIEGQLLEILSWDESKRKDLARGFVQIGLDSLMAVELQFRLQKALKFAPPPERARRSTRARRRGGSPGRAAPGGSAPRHPAPRPPERWAAGPHCRRRRRRRSPGRPARWERRGPLAPTGRPEERGTGARGPRPRGPRGSTARVLRAGEPSAGVLVPAERSAPGAAKARGPEAAPAPAAR